MLLSEHFERAAAWFPGRVAVLSDAAAITYAEMRRLVHAIARALMRAGVRPDDPVAILSPNHPFVLACQFGIVRAGAMWTPVNYRNVHADNVKLLSTLKARFLFFHSTLADQISAIRAAVPSLVGAVCIDRPIGGDPALLDWIEPIREDTMPFPPRAMTDAMALLSTSGTTGEPKSAVHDHLAFETMIESFQALMHFDGPPVNLVVTPLSHAAGSVPTILLQQGATNVLLSSPDPGAILAAIEKHRATVLFLPPTVIYMMLAHPDLRKYDYSSLRYFIYGAAPMSVEKLKEAVAAFGPVMLQIYGQTEAIQPLTIMTPQEHGEILANPAVAHRIASAGRPGPFVRVAILDDQGNEVPRGTRGEICVQGELVMCGYYRNQKATDEVSSGGWHHTGDVGYIDEDDYVYIVDRKKDMIITGGFNVFPGEVEQAALAHPAVQDCVVIGAPHEKWGEMVTAAVELKAGARFDEEEFIAFCKERLGSVKAPKKVDVWASLPRSTNGKTLRRVVRDKLWEGRQRRI